jgi:predicted PurR-regulated permease PerM
MATGGGNGVPGRMGRGLSRLRSTQQRKSDERFAQRFSAQWTALRAERQHLEEAPPVIEVGTSNYSRAQVPFGVDLAAAWSWRFLVIVGAGYVVSLGIAIFSVALLPVVIALLLSALVSPVVGWLQRGLRMGRGLASLLVVIGTLAVMGLLLTFAGQQIANGADNLSNQVVGGLEQIRSWMKHGPLHASEGQINGYIQAAQDAVTTSNKHVVSRITEVGTALGHIVAGFFIVLFGTYFFLADGDRIWAWLVRLFPRAARGHVDSSGRVAWSSLTAFVRATVLVAFTDALGIMIGAAVLGLPLVFAIGVLIFIGAFIPLIGATITGAVAVLVALVDQGPLVALLMLLVVIGVQQLEAHVLQPFLMGRLVSLHPLGVILALAAGVLLAGIPGALVAVPFAAATNAVVVHLADKVKGEKEDAEDFEGALGDDAPPDAVD